MKMVFFFYNTTTTVLDAFMMRILDERNRLKDSMTFYLNIIFTIVIVVESRTFVVLSLTQVNCLVLNCKSTINSHNRLSIQNGVQLLRSFFYIYLSPCSCF